MVPALAIVQKNWLRSLLEQERIISIRVYGADIGKLGSSINHIFDDLRVLADPGDARRGSLERRIGRNNN
jgi:hypothetical protein